MKEGGAAPETDSSEETGQHPQGRGFSWPAMLGIMGAALLAAGAIAYRLVAPFFHH